MGIVLISIKYCLYSLQLFRRRVGGLNPILKCLGKPRKTGRVTLNCEDILTNSFPTFYGAIGSGNRRQPAAACTPIQGPWFGFPARGNPAFRLPEVLLELRGKNKTLTCSSTGHYKLF